jgi:hypothetical protein
VRALDLAVEVGLARLDVDVAHAEVLHVPVELRLPLVPVVGADRVDAEGEALDHVVDEVDRALLVVARVDAQSADPGRVVDRRELIALQAAPSAPLNCRNFTSTCTWWPGTCFS